MATVCDACGFRDNEVKAGAGIEPKGKRMTLRLTDVSDLSRDVLKVSLVESHLRLSDEGFMSNTLTLYFNTTLQGA